MLSVAVGIHPHRAAACDRDAIARLRELARDDVVVAIGEIGMDLSGRSAPPELQARAFRDQLDLAAALDLPVVVHVRDAGAEVRAILARAPVVRGQVHCYSEGPDEVDEWVARGFHVSFAGTVTFERSDRLRAALRHVPDDRLLFETDAPYLAPVPHRGSRNEPSFVVATVAFAARERGVDASSLAQLSTRNARTLFGPRIPA